MHFSLLIRKKSVLKWALVNFFLDLYIATATYLNPQLHNIANKVKAFIFKTHKFISKWKDNTFYFKNWCLLSLSTRGGLELMKFCIAISCFASA